MELTETIWLPQGFEHPDMLIQSPKTSTDNKANQALSPADSGKVRQNPQPPRNKIETHRPEDSNHQKGMPDEAD